MTSRVEVTSGVPPFRENTVREAPRSTHAMPDPPRSSATCGRVLRSMRRGYDREGYLHKIEGLRRRIPEINLGTDVIVGYPTESEADFQQTLSLLDEVGFDTVYAFAYSTRPATAALELHGER